MGEQRRSLIHVVLSLGAGGTERLVIDMCARTAERADLKVICLDERGAWANHLADRGIEVLALGRQPGFQPALAWQILKIALASKAQVLHCHHYSPFIYGCLAALCVPGLRVVYTEHGRLSDDPPSTKRRVANLLFGHTPGRFFAVSADLRQHMLAEGFPANRVGVAHNGVEPGPLPGCTEREQARATLGLEPQDFVIGTIARLDPVKDLATLLSAADMLCKDAPNVHLVVIGDGPERDALEGLARDCERPANIHFAGQRDDARALLPAFDVYVNSSVMEGISVTILEALASGLPVVATAVGGTPEILEDGRSGLLVQPRAPRSLAAELRKLYDDAELTTRLATAGRQRVQSEFSFERMLSQYHQAYGW